MPEPTEPQPDGAEPETVRLPDSDLESIEAKVRKLMTQSKEQARQLDTLAAPDRPDPFAAFGMPGLPASRPQPPEARPILELQDEEFEDELDALTDWVDGFLMDTYGAEVTTAAPWCRQWQEHADVVAWLHALWMAYQQHREPDAGQSGMLVWHRDFLTHTMAAVRAQGGPMSACMTDPARDAHRLLPGPRPSARSGDSTSGGPAEDADPGRGTA